MEQINARMQAHLDNLTKPRGSLGNLEEYCLKMARIQGKVPPTVGKKGVYVFAGDHGIAGEGVSLYPAEVSRQMALNMFAGGAAINALAGGTHWELTVVDAGIAGEEFAPDSELKPRCRFLRRRIRSGSGNFAHESAMTEAQTQAALECGRELARDVKTQGYYMTAIGDLGIGNTSTAAAMMIAAGFSPQAMIDRGTEIGPQQLLHKQQVIKAAITRCGPLSSGEAILKEYGSPDFAMMAGFILGLTGCACVLDGFPVTAAAYIASMINPRVRDWLFAGHLSKAGGHRHLLTALNLEPIVQLDMRLGEGTGAVIGGHIIELGMKASLEMASFAAAQVSDTDTKEQ
ncbi:nicotinate-nucleotide--dimethylbenzimidazole phosphoribosyltransferase [Breznakiellaceae bacterium SP9]